MKDTSDKILGAVRLSRFHRGLDVNKVCEVKFDGYFYSFYIREDGFASLQLAGNQRSGR